MSATTPENASTTEAPLTRREIREREAAEAAARAEASVTVEDAEVEVEEIPVAPPSDSGLPSLFGDDKKEEVVEAPILAAAYAREAPAAKYLEGQPLVDFDSEEKAATPTQTLHHMQHQNHHETYHHAQPIKQHHVPAVNSHQEGWTTGSIIKVAALSLLYSGLTLAAIAVPIAITVAEMGTLSP